MVKFKAFSLIELLVVIAIISILAGFLMPALENALGSARVIKCLNNEKQLTFASLQYSSDNNDYMPYGHRIWQECYPYYIAPYFGEVVYDGTEYDYYGTVHLKSPSDSVFACPSPTKLWPGYDTGGWTEMPSYGFNANVLVRVVGGQYSGPFKATSFKKPGNTFVFIDSWCYTGIGKDWTQGIFVSYNLMDYAGYRCNWDAHNGGADVSFLDGHALWVEDRHDFISEQ